MYPEIGVRTEFRSAATLTNSLVITTKTMNLFLFCMWSGTFRKNLARILMAKLETSVLRLLKDACWQKKTKESKTKVTHNYSEPARTVSPNKRSISGLMRTPAFLQMRHSLPAKIEPNEMEKSEQEVLLN